MLAVTLLPLAMGQLLPPLFGNSTCDLSTLQSRVTQVDLVCATDICTPDCVPELLPLAEDCATIINKQLDSSDGRDDGEYDPFTQMVNSCNQLTVPELLDYIRTHCPNVDLDGVAATEIKDTICEDVWGDRCGAMLATGVLTCEVDFCDTTPTMLAPCDQTGLCDQTCGFCEGGRHRLQMFGQCDPSSFTIEAQAVDTACCDDPTCVDGIPAECDAKCSIVYTNFYRRCQSFLAGFNHAQLDVYDRLFSTCTQALPVEPLLQIVEQCGACPDCGEHESCVEGECQCDAVGVCDHGQCTANGCECEPGFIGELCDQECPCDRGQCTADGCECEPGFIGELCDQECPCDHGQCVRDGCECEPGFIGELCDEQCPCDHGQCTADGCECAEGFGGNMCSLEAQQWTALPDMPTSRSALTASIYDGVLYAVGGSGGQSTLEAYTISTQQWTALPDMPTARYYLAASIYDGVLYAVGGYDGSNRLPTLEAYTISTQQWTALPDMPTARSALAASIYDGVLYAVGGSNGNYLPTLEAYIISTQQWTALPDMPTARYGLAASTYDGVLYAVGGYPNFPTLEAYTISTQQWIALPDMPTARYYLAASIYDGVLYAVGGDGGQSTLEAYTISTQQWTTLPDMPTGHSGLAASIYDGVLYAVGGSDGNYLSTLEAYII
eukprot:SAG11_NODE_248_length_11654_cov_27.840329_8_plen_667_part_00